MECNYANSVDEEVKVIRQSHTLKWSFVLTLRNICGVHAESCFLSIPSS